LRARISGTIWGSCQAPFTSSTTKTSSALPVPFVDWVGTISPAVQSPSLGHDTEVATNSAPGPGRGAGKVSTTGLFHRPFLLSAIKGRARPLVSSKVPATAQSPALGHDRA